MRCLTNIILLLFGSSLYAQTPNAENEFAKKVLAVFKEKDYNSYKKLCVTHKDYVDEILPALQEEAKRMHHSYSFSQADEIYTPAHLDSLNKVVFRMIKDQGVKAGITDWNKIAFSGFEFLDGVVPKKEEKIINVNIWFTYHYETFGLYALMIGRFTSGYRVYFVRGLGKQK